MFNAAKIAELQEQLRAAQERVTQLEADNTSITAARDAAAADVTRLQAELTTKLGELTASTASLTQLKADHAAEIARLNADMEQRIQTEVTNRCAAAGLETPIARDPGAGASSSTGEGKPAPAAGLTGLAKSRAALQAKHDALTGKN